MVRQVHGRQFGVVGNDQSVKLMFTHSDTEQCVGQHKENMGPESFAEVNIKVTVTKNVVYYTYSRTQLYFT